MLCEQNAGKLCLLVSYLRADAARRDPVYTALHGDFHHRRAALAAASAHRRTKDDGSTASSGTREAGRRGAAGVSSI